MLWCVLSAARATGSPSILPPTWMPSLYAPSQPLVGAAICASLAAAVEPPCVRLLGIGGVSDDQEGGRLTFDRLTNGSIGNV